MARRREYPHVDQVRDPQIQQALRILFDRVFDVSDGLDTANATLRDQTTQVDTMRRQLAATTALAASAVEVAGKLTSDSPGTVFPPPPPGGGGGEGAPDDGASGCAQAPSTGHLSLTPEESITFSSSAKAGMIVCGTANEYPSLLAATVDLPTREANAEELLGRMIWHLQNGAADPVFAAGRQRNPSGAISLDKVAILIDGGWRAYDVFIGLDNFTVPMSTAMQPVVPADPVPDGGIPD